MSLLCISITAAWPESAKVLQDNRSANGAARDVKCRAMGSTALGKLKMMEIYRSRFSRKEGVVPVDYCFWVVSLFRIERIREQFEKDARKGGKRESKRARTFGFCFCFSAPTPIPSTTWEEQRNQRFRCDLLSLIRKRKVPRARRRSDLARRIQNEHPRTAAACQAAPLGVTGTRTRWRC